MIMADTTRPSGEGRKPEFEDDKEWAEFVLEHYFGALVPGEPFLLIVRVCRSDYSGHHYPQEWMVTEYYLGKLAEKAPLTALFNENDAFKFFAFAIRTVEFCCFPRIHSEKEGGLTDYGTGDIKFSYFNLHETPVRAPFAPPYRLGLPTAITKRDRDEGVTAFSLAVGLKAMEALRLEETERERDFSKWFVRASARLGLPLLSEDAKERHAELKREIVANLLAARDRMAPLAERIARVKGNVGGTMMEGGALTIVTDEVAATLMTIHERDKLKEFRREIRGMLTRGREIGMHNDAGWVQVAGISYQPARVLQDFETLFPA